MKTLLDGYFTDKSYIEKEFGHAAFCHRLREMEFLADIEDYAATISIQEVHVKYLLYDLQMILEVFSYILKALKKAKEKSLIEMDIPVIIHPDIENLKILLGIPEDKFEKTLYVSSLFNLKKLLGSIVNSIIFPHFLLNQIENTENITKWNSLKNEIQNKIDSDFINIPLDLGSIDNFLVGTYDLVEKVKEKAKEYANTVLKETQNFLTSFLFFSGLFVGGFYIARKSIDYIFTKKNPPDYDLYDYAKRLKSDLNKSDFNRALSTFKSQHGRLPNKNEIKMVSMPAGLNLPIAVEVGKLPSLTYIPPSGRKSPYHYKHDMNETKLCSDPSGNNLFLLGRTYLDVSDGWLKN